LKQAIGNTPTQARLQADKQEANEQLLPEILGILKSSHLSSTNQVTHLNNPNPPEVANSLVP